MDIKQFISTVTLENAETLSQEYLNYERNRENQKGQKYSITAFLRNISRARNEIRRAGLDENLEDFLLKNKKGLRASEIEWEHKENLFSGNLHEKQRNCQFFNPFDLVEVATKYLDNKSIKYQLASLCLLTGRRPIEILYSGLFFDGNTPLLTAIDDTVNHLKGLGYEKINITSEQEILKTMVDYHNSDDLGNGLYILFSGQAKQRKDKDDNRRQPFPIPTLIESKLIINAIKSLRDKLEIPSHLQQHEISDYLHNRFSKEVGGVIKKIYKEVLPPSALSPSELRGLYAVSCFHFNHGHYSPMNQSVYIANILGHNPKNLKSVFSYDNYKVLE